MSAHGVTLQHSPFCYPMLPQGAFFTPLDWCLTEGHTMQNVRGNTGWGNTRSRLVVACIVGLCTAPAAPLNAQPAPQPPPATAASTPAATGPQATTGERSCVSLMPNGLQTLQGKTVPVLVVRVGLDAKLHDAQLSRSSGDESLDKALIACANGHAFLPVTVKGKPAEVRWV